MPQDESEKVVGEYKHRYVAFLDLLGFKAQVECAEHSPAERAKLHDILLLVRDTIGGNPAPRLAFQLLFRLHGGIGRPNSSWPLGDVPIYLHV